MSVGGDQRRGSVVIEDEIDREAIVRTLISKEERRRVERAALIQQMEHDDGTEKTETDERKSAAERPNIKCPYLDTINRKVLDFDFEKLCSISLSHLNVYCCLVCSKYFQGNGH